MRQFETVENYVKNTFKPNERIIFAGYGILDGLKTSHKTGTYKTVKIKSNGDLLLRNYRGRTNLVLGANMYDQQCQVLTKEEFNQLK